jgi:MFS family permease
VESPAAAALVRDRISWLAYSQYALFGYFLYAFTPSVNLLRSDEHTSRAVSALHGTGMAVGSIAVGLVAPWLVRRFGRRTMVWASLATMCAGVVVLTSCTVVPVTIAGAVIGSFGGTFLANLAAAILTTHHRGAAGGAAVTEGTGIGAALGIFAPLLLAGAIAIHVGWRAGMQLVVVFAVAVALVFGRSARPEDDGNATGSRPATTRARLPREFWRACGVLVMTTAVEFSMTIWSSDVLQTHDGLSKGDATAGVTAIIVGLTAGRLLSGRLALRYHADTLLLAAFALTIVGFAAFWTASTALPAYLGLAVTGAGMSVQYPLATTRAIRFADGHTDLALSYATLGTGAAVALAPFGLGAIADHVGSHTAMLIVPIFVLLAATAVITARRPSVPLVAAPIPAAREAATLS